MGEVTHRPWECPGFACKDLGGPICSSFKRDAQGRSDGGEKSLRMALRTHPTARLVPRWATWTALILCAWVLLALGAGRLSAQPLGQPAAERPVLLVDIKGAIGVVSSAQLTKALERAAVVGAQVLVVRIDTPGGLLSSTREMIHAILASPVPVVMYVAPNGSRAASA